MGRVTYLLRKTQNIGWVLALGEGHTDGGQTSALFHPITQSHWDKCFWSPSELGTGLIAGGDALPAPQHALLPFSRTLLKNSPPNLYERIRMVTDSLEEMLQSNQGPCGKHTACPMGQQKRDRACKDGEPGCHPPHQRSYGPGRMLWSH